MIVSIRAFIQSLTFENNNKERNIMAYALTTVDNPYNPFEDWDHWFLYDVVNDYNSCAYLARIATTSDQLTEEENLKEIERAIDEIVSFNPKLYKKVESTNKPKDKQTDLKGE